MFYTPMDSTIRPEWKIARAYFDRDTGVLFDDVTCDFFESQDHYDQSMEDYHRAKRQGEEALFVFMGVKKPLPAWRYKDGGMSKEELREKVKISTVAAILTDLRRVGTDKYQAKCPWHQDRMASLSVNDDKGLWHCFAGCGGGDIFSFLMKQYDCSFRDALRYAQQFTGG